MTSESEEDSPCKNPLASRNHRVLGNIAKRSLFQELNEMTEEETEELGQQIQKCYRAKVAQESDEDTAIIFGGIHSKLAGGRSSTETIVLDSGCTKDIVAEAIVKDLGLKVQKLDKPLVINGADGNRLNITGTVNLFFSCQATGEKRKRIQAAVLSGGKDRELLVSLQNLKRFRMIHQMFPHETIDQFFIRYRNKCPKEYSNVYKISSEEYNEPEFSYYKRSRDHLKKPSRAAEDLQKKFVEKYKDNFRGKLGKNDRLNVKPISLTVDPDKLAAHKPTTHLKPYDVPYHLRKG